MPCRMLPYLLLVSLQFFPFVPAMPSFLLHFFPAVPCRLRLPCGPSQLLSVLPPPSAAAIPRGWILASPSSLLPVLPYLLFLVCLPCLLLLPYHWLLGLP